MTYLKLGVKDNAVGNISGGISASTTTIVLVTGNGEFFPAGQQFIGTLVQYNTPADPTSGVAKSEKVLVTVRSTDTLTVTRGYDGSTATTFLNGDYFYLNITSKVVSDIQDEVTRLETDKQNAIGGFWKSIYRNATGVLAELAFGTAGKVFTSNGASSAPSWEVPTVDINSLSEDTAPDMDNDLNLEYDVSGSANKKYKMSSYRSTDGEATAGTLTTKFITPKQAKDNYGNNYLGSVSLATNGSVTVPTGTKYILGSAFAYTSASGGKLFYQDIIIGPNKTSSVLSAYWGTLGVDATFTLSGTTLTSSASAVDGATAPAGGGTFYCYSSI